MLKPLSTRDFIQSLLKEVTDLEKPIYFVAAFAEEDRVPHDDYFYKDDYEVDEIIEYEHSVEVRLW